MSKIKLTFTTAEDLRRELVLGFSNVTTDGLDYGYDARVNETFVNDLILPLGLEDNMVIQGYSNITPDKVVDLSFISDGTTSYSIAAEELDIALDNLILTHIITIKQIHYM